MSDAIENQEIIIDQIDLNEEEREFISSVQTKVHYSKGAIILSEGQLTDKCFYVFKGCVRKFHLKDGVEITTDFFTEGDPIATRPSGVMQLKSSYNLECIEDCIVTIITARQEEQIYAKFPRFQSMCRIMTEQKLMEYQDRLSKFIASTPEERYLNIQNTRPDLLNRVPQYQLASYLGIKPESLSRIRKRLMSRA